ncbi:SNARE-binding exocyst subunit SEC6 SCDLUD_000330 [Saccharomycodes ludwigii]|uniref:SNARE-binding exocyst subunit SEC6 n=1 Tax=Saccharomycodes ludwigii TaxID=36035 RepID=UPI001E8AAD1A|nr:hypothetical protein SCDLUD_000330 [Saccharomycodes ludwigii]KAH3902742.1 hypothetical protein SCDLUD_000330 [Saccharomycodes ludwigii]
MLIDDYALKKVSQLIKDEVALGSITEIKEQLIKEKSTIDYQLRRSTEVHFDTIQSGFDALTSSQKYVTSLKNKVHTIHELSEESKQSIEHYDIVKDATKIQEIMDQTTNIYDKILSFNDTLSRIDNMINYELSQDSIETGCSGLLEIHFILSMLRDFQEHVNVLATVSNDDVQRTIPKIFQNSSETIERFNSLLENITYDLIEAFRAGNKSLLIRYFKIIEFEDREDTKIKAMRYIIHSKEKEIEATKIRKLPSDSMLYNKINGNDVENQISGDNQPSNRLLANEILNGTVTGRINPRNYKKFMIEVINRSIREMFVEVRKEYTGDKKFEVINNLDWVLNELFVAQKHLTECCPRSLDIFKIYFDAYYKEMKSLMSELVEAEPETIIILDILDFDKQFTKSLMSDFGFKKDDIKSILGDKEKETLLDDYLNLILMKMKEWIGNLEKTELEIFVERKTPPIKDAENLLCLDGTKTCFQMFTQQAEVAAGSGQVKILLGVIEKFCGLLNEREKIWIRTIQSEVGRWLNYNRKCRDDPEDVTKDDECAAGLIEYLIAVANDQMRAADYAVAISQKYGDMVNKTNAHIIENLIEGTLDGFAQVAKCSTSGLISVIFDDLQKPYAEIFSKNWYTGNQAQQISDTLMEYLSDVKLQMNPFVYSTFVENVIEETILKFFNALKYEHSFKIKRSKFLDAMKRDFEIFYKLFIQFVTDKEARAVVIDGKFKFVEFFMDLCCEPSDTLLATWSNLLKTYPDCPVTLLSGILMCRDDISSSNSKDILINARQIEKAALDKAKQDPDYQPTFMSNFTLN